jgi:hypothetical protein
MCFAAKTTPFCGGYTRQENAGGGGRCYASLAKSQRPKLLQFDYFSKFCLLCKSEAMELRPRWAKVIALLVFLFAVAQALIVGVGAQRFSWAWMSGSNETDQFGTYGSFRATTRNPAAAPAARVGQAYWYDSFSGDLFLFGGRRTNATTTVGTMYFGLMPNSEAQTFFVTAFNDLWRYSIANQTWTWMAGNNYTNANGVYGIRGETGNPGNTPGARANSAFWMDDEKRELWLFGGVSDGRNSTFAISIFAAILILTLS